MMVAFLVSAFIVPHSVVMTGTTGIGLAVSKAFHIDVSLIVLILNVSLLIFGWIVFGTRFLLTTVASSLLYPLFLAVMERVPNIGMLTNDPLLAVLFAGLMLGVALGLVIRVGSSTGGMDVINLAMQKWLHWPLSVCVWITDITILAVQAAFSKPEDVLYGAVLIIVETLVLNQVMLLGQSQIQIMVVSSKYEDIRKTMLSQLQAGVTMQLIETGYEGQAQKSVLCVIPPRKLFAAKEMIYDIDPNAFLTITQIREVRGQGFSYERREIK